MRPVHQLVAAATPGDAVTEQALRWQEVLRGWGHPSELLAEHVHPTLAGRVHRLDGRGPRVLENAGGLVLHYSIWSAAAETAVAHGAPLGVVYHNVTPGDLLRPANRQIAAMCDQGRVRLTALGGRVTALVADSAFNAVDLADAGLGEAAVVPLLLSPATPPDRIAPATGPPHLLSVGRIVPNKRLEDVVRVHALLQRAHEPHAELTLMGSWQGFEPYHQALVGQVAGLGSAAVHLTGKVPDAQRDAAYDRASVYVCMSVHEGFCLPLIEALQRGLPVVARAAAAIPETLGDAGLVLPDDDLAVFAEAALEASRSTALRATLAAAARARLDELAPERVIPRMRDALAPVLGAAS
ncbi:MAG: glycosyltransferase family 4 protein [Thermoleophilia bacterium]|nr:glycosyltransferase family 4 protein [Thermoleophilia bacterium]